jgi:hypothetical protein
MIRNECDANAIHRRWKYAYTALAMRLAAITKLRLTLASGTTL